MRAGRMTLLGAIAAASLLAAACTGGSNSGAPNNGAGTGSSTAGGSITVGLPQGITDLNPATRTFAAEETLFPLLWDGLTQTDPGGKVLPDLATSWSASSDQKTWTFTLRRGVKFNDGSALTATDVVKTFDYYRNPKTATQEANKVAPITSVTATNPTTVQFKLNDPNSSFPAAIVWVKILKQSNLANIEKDPIGTGPYKLSAYVPNDHVTLVRNPDYWGKRAPLDKITLTAATNATSAVNALDSGDLDVIWALPASDVAKEQANTNITLVKPKIPSQWPSWEVDTTSAPFSNVAARQALAYAVDRNQVFQAAYFGQGVVSQTNDPLGTNNPDYATSGLTDYSYNLQKAKQLFAQAGVHTGDTLIWWGVAGAYPEWNTSGQILQASLKQIGINLKIENHDASTWAAKFYPAGKKYPDTIVPNFQSTPVAPAYSLNFLLKGRCECNWDDPAYEAAYNKALGERDPATQKSDWAAVQQIASQQVPVIVPLQASVVAATSSNLKGVWMEGGGQLHLEDASLASS